LDFYEVVCKRRSVREFQSKPIDQKKIQRILEAGLRAPSHNHLREWEFILVKDFGTRKMIVEASAKAEDVKDTKRLEEATKDMTDETQKQMYLKALPVQKRMLMTSPELLAVCFRMKKHFNECQTLYELNNFASVWTCIENILLAMAAEGLYGVTYIPYDTRPLKEVLDVPEDYEVAAIIPIGYPADYSVKQKLVSLKEKIHYNRW
jgi:nitroreductase